LGGIPGLRRTTGATSPIIRPKIIWPQAIATTRKEPVVIAATQKEPAVIAANQKEPAVIAATQKEPVVVTATTHHQRLLGKLPQRPSVKRKAVVPPAPSSQPPPAKDVDLMAPLDGNYLDDDEPVDIDTYINTGATSLLWMKKPSALMAINLVVPLQSRSA
jgi:hypothetical protein